MRSEECVAGAIRSPEQLRAVAASAGPEPLAEFARWFVRPGLAPQSESRAYILARSRVGWIDLTAPLGWEVDLMTDLRRGGSFACAFASAIGQDLAKLESAWLADLRRP